MKLFVLISFPILLLLNIYDIYSTSTLMALGIEEANPFLRWLMRYFGTIPTLVLTKIIFIYILFEACIFFFQKETQTIREKYAIISAFVILIGVYSYFMYTTNYQLMLLI